MALKVIRTHVLPLLRPIVHPLFAICLSLIVGAFAILLTGGNPLEVYVTMFNGAFGSTFFLLATLTRATPIIICGIGSAICWKSGYMGIGGEGQMIMGGFACAVTALYVPGAPFFRFICAVLAAVVAGGCYSLFSAWLLDKFKMSLAISTLMLNYSARYITMHFVANLFLDKEGDMKIVQTVQIAQEMRLPRFIQTHSLHYGFAFAVLLVLVIWFVLNRTKFGYESRMTGLNRKFCEYGGINSRKVMYAILTLSGAICAMAGASEVLGLQYRYLHDSYVSASFAWIGLNAALISGFHPVGILFSSIVLSGVQTGGSAIARSMNMPVEISTIIQGCITLFISARIVINWRFRKRRPAASDLAEPKEKNELLQETAQGGVEK